MTDQDSNSISRAECEATIQHIKRLWGAGTQVPEIARAVHLPGRLVIHIIQTGRWPESSLVQFNQPQPLRESER